MHKLRHYLNPRPRYRGVLWLLAAALLAGAAVLATQAWQAHEAQSLIDERIAQRREALKPKPAPVPTRAELDVQRRWASLDSERSFAWYPVFLAIEQASSDKIELLEFAPDKSARRITLRGEARDLPALFAYVEALSAQPAFSKVYLAQQKNKVSGALTTVTFELRGQLR
ncbi:hypothetical protein [Pseudoduganella rhizocola]|uniref:hypothetical protein n=1 Tax=Pseudoduganella rhizocola TaxID=3382643 RepID=UPI0038B56822